MGKAAALASSLLVLVMLALACSAPEKKEDNQIKLVELTEDLCIEIWVRARNEGTKKRIILTKQYGPFEKEEMKQEAQAKAENKVFNLYGVKREDVEKCFSGVRNSQDGKERILKVSDKIKEEEHMRIDAEPEFGYPKKSGNIKIISKPPSKTQIGERFEYQVEAVHTGGKKPEAGGLLFRLLRFPMWMRMNKQTGKIVGRPCCYDLGDFGCKTGRNNIVVQAYDDHGNIDTQEFAIEVLPSDPKINFTGKSKDEEHTVKVGEQILLRQYADYVTCTLDEVTFDLSYMVTPDDGGLQLESSVVKTWKDTGCTSFFPVYSATGKKPGRYDVKTTLTVRENGCTGHATTVVVVE